MARHPFRPQKRHLHRRALMSIDHETIVDFWVGDPDASADELKRRSQRWFSADPKLDAEIESRFGPLLANRAAGVFDGWKATPRGRLGLIILLDQFPRNIYRGRAEAFAFDDLALELTQSGIDAGMDRTLAPLERMFFYMPLQHAEAPEPQQRSMTVFQALADSCPEGQRPFFQLSLSFASEHRDLIARFGRFPHRNRAMGRASTEEEIEFLDGGGKTYGQ